ncbi:MAG: hypothetical protein KGJ13_02380 [Patescibacteria group bacterium]|nr:hypothetical protein [Patescibacteria group bacterium]
MAAEGNGALVPVQRRIVVWDKETGMPVVGTVPSLSPSQITEVAAAAAVTVYKEDGDDLAAELGLPTSEFYGMTCLEVMLIRQAREGARTGDSGIVNDILDRLVGKPKQTTESVVTKLTYEDRLKEIARRRALEAKTINPAS